MTSEDLNQVDSLPLKLAISAAVSRCYFKNFQQMPSRTMTSSEMNNCNSKLNVRSMDDGGSKINGYDANNNKRRVNGRQPEQNRFITSLLHPRFCEKLSKSQSTVSGIPNRCRMTMGTAYRDLLFNDVRRTQHLFNGLLRGINSNQEPNSTEPILSSEDKGGKSTKQPNFQMEEESSSFIGTHIFPGSGSIRSDVFYDAEDAYGREPIMRENHDYIVNDGDECTTTSAFRRKNNTKQNSSSSSDKFFCPFDSENENLMDDDTTNHFEFETDENGSKEDSIRDNFLNDSLLPSQGSSVSRHRYTSEFNDDFLSPFEFTVENRRNRAADEFTPSNRTYRISSPRRRPDFTAETNGEISNFFEFDDDDHYLAGASTDAINNDFTLSDFSQHVDISPGPAYRREFDDYNSEFNERSQNDNSVLPFDPVQSHSEENSNSFNFRFPTPPVHSGDNFLDDEQSWSSEITNSPSVIEATPVIGGNDQPLRNKISHVYPRNKIEEMLENGSEMYFRDSKRHKVTNYEDTDAGTEVSTPISTKKAKELLPLISYVHNGRLIVEENNDYSYLT